MKPTKEIKYSFDRSPTETWKLRKVFLPPLQIPDKALQFSNILFLQNAEVPVNMPALPILDDPLLLQLHLQQQQERMIAQR